jgi:hypothetical protein
MSNLVESIKMKLKVNFNGVLDCEEQRADLYTYIDGCEETINKIDTETIYFSGFNIDLADADIHTLSYINEVLG